MEKQLPVARYQDFVLYRLGLQAKSFTDANRIFAEIGISVTFRREGRHTFPVITILDGFAGGFNEYGEGEEYSRNFKKVDLTKAAEWIANPERLPQPKAEEPKQQEQSTFEKYIEMTLVQGDPAEDRTPEEQAELDADAEMSWQEGTWAEEAAIVASIEAEKKQRGGARPGAGRPKLGTTYEEGYQAGYKVAERKAGEILYRVLRKANDDRFDIAWPGQHPPFIVLKEDQEILTSGKQGYRFWMLIGTKDRQATERYLNGHPTILQYFELENPPFPEEK